MSYYCANTYWFVLFVHFWHVLLFLYFLAQKITLVLTTWLFIDIQHPFYFLLSYLQGKHKYCTWSLYKSVCTLALKKKTTKIISTAGEPTSNREKLHVTKSLKMEETTKKNLLNHPNLCIINHEIVILLHATITNYNHWILQ